MNIPIGNLDTGAMKQWWNGGKHGQFSAFKNCSDTVCKALQVGGMPMPSHVIHHPKQVHDDANKILNGGWEGKMNIILKGITLFLIAGITLFTLLVNHIQLIVGEESMHKNIKLHFQKLVCGSPQDKFLVASFNGVSGEMDWVDEYDLPPKQVSNDNKSFLGFVHRFPNTHYGVTLKRISDTRIKYNFYLMDLDSNMIILDLGGQEDYGFLHEDFYFLKGWDLKKTNLKSKQVIDVEQNITALAYSEKHFWKFTVDGKIIEVSLEGERQIGKFKGVVSEAAHLADDWLCYYQRRNEKVLGYL
ncbi:MAG: hypothetical protein H8D23_06945 [Candidatus Brocadiales bacterium]|nr:hypothetical protein [Candidatus Brocadiales bacterium]